MPSIQDHKIQAFLVGWRPKRSLVPPSITSTGVAVKSLIHTLMNYVNKRIPVSEGKMIAIYDFRVPKERVQKERATGVELEWDSLRFDQDLVTYSFKHHLSVFGRFFDEFNMSNSELTKRIVENFKLDSRSSKVGKRCIEIIGCMAVDSSMAERVSLS